MALANSVGLFISNLVVNYFEYGGGKVTLWWEYPLSGQLRNDFRPYIVYGEYGDGVSWHGK